MFKGKQVKKTIMMAVAAVALSIGAYLAVQPANGAVGDVEVTLTLPVAHVAKVLEALNWAAGARMSLEIDKHDPLVPNVHARYDFQIAAKDPNETQQEFGKRCMANLVVAVVRAKALSDDEERYRTEVSTINPPSQNIPDDVVE